MASTERPHPDLQQFVCDAYQLMLGRAPDPLGMAGALDALDKGQSQRAFLASIAQSDEFAARVARFHPASPSSIAAQVPDQRFVESAYRELLGREPDADGLAGAKAYLAGGGSRRGLLTSIIDSREFEHRLATSVRVTPLPSLIAMHPERYRRSGDFIGFIVDSDADYDWLEQMISEHRYYERPGPWGYGFDHDKKNLADLIARLHPRKVLEVGCGDGSTLHGLRQLNVDCIGLDISSYARDHALPDVRDRIVIGDLLDVTGTLGGVDTLCGFDIFEHLNPNKFPQYLHACSQILPRDGMLLINVPAFGDDDLYGNAMGVWTEEWHADLESHSPFSFIPCDDHGFPLMGHLVWADSVWWESTFKANGFLRVRDLERLLHQHFDPIFEYSHARRAFLLFAKELGDQRQRALISRMTRPQ